jgi:glutaminase
MSQNENIDYDEDTADSEYEEGYRNFAMINLLRSYGNIQNDVEEVLDFYFHLCSIKMSCSSYRALFFTWLMAEKTPAPVSVYLPEASQNV